MAFDRKTFASVLKQRLVAAATPGFVPVPDEAIADEAEREARHGVAVARMHATHRRAVAEAGAHNIAYLAARRVPELWPEPPEAGAEIDAAALVAAAQAGIAQGGSDALADAGLQLLIASVLQTLKE